MFKIGDLVEVLDKTAGLFDLCQLEEISKGNIVRIDKLLPSGNIGVNILSHIYKEHESTWIFSPTDLKLLNHQERLNRKYNVIHKKTT